MAFQPLLLTMRATSDLYSPVTINFSSLIPKMLISTLAILHLTTWNLPWFMDLTFQVPMQYFFLQHQPLLSSPDTSTTGSCFPFGSASSFFFWSYSLLSSSSILDTYHPGGGPSYSVISYSLLIQFIGFLRQEYWTDLPFPSPVDYLLSKLSTMKVLRSSITSMILAVTLFPVFLSSTLFSLVIWFSHR